MLANNNKREFETYINESIKYLELLRDGDIIVAIDELISQIHSSIESGGKIIFCGNCGSASDSQHLAAELVGRYKLHRVPLPAIALNTDTSVITAISNDFGYEKIFERQIEALGNSTDLLVAISTSGESKNIVNAIIAAKKKNIYTVALTQEGNSSISKMCDLSIGVPSNKVNHIHQMHILIGHIVCEALEKKYLEKK